MVTEETTNTPLTNALFLNHYLAKSTSEYYGGANLKQIEVQHFDPNSIPEISFDLNDSVPFVTGEIEKTRKVIKNYCEDSNYVGFSEVQQGSTKIFVTNGETGAVVYSQNKPTSGAVHMFDHTLVFTNWDEKEMSVVDILTQKEIKKKFPARVVLGFVTADTVALRCKNEVILWNFKTDSEIKHLGGAMPMEPITMIYNDMWVMYSEGKLRFYSMKNGTLINTLLLRLCFSRHISLLSDGRIGIAHRFGCRVISFMDSEVNRKIQVEVMNIEGKITTHEISAFELSQFFVDQVKKPHELMTSRVIQYSIPCQSDERFVLIFAQDSGIRSPPFNDPATKLLSTARQPTNVNAPFQGWRVDVTRKEAVVETPCCINNVCGKAIIVREKIIDGRWQLVSM
jgi:hypothetical protein